MVFRRRHRQNRSAPQIADEHHRAYVLIEEARVRCERIRSASPATGRRSLLVTLHRELGLAGYWCCEDIDAASRQLLLEQARRRAAEPDSHAPDELVLLVQITAAARRAIGDPPSEGDSLARMHVALMHLLCAIQSLERLVAGPHRTADSRQRIR